jgi:hypothetical protein
MTRNVLLVMFVACATIAWTSGSLAQRGGDGGDRGQSGARSSNQGNQSASRSFSRGPSSQGSSQRASGERQAMRSSRTFDNQSNAAARSRSPSPSIDSARPGPSVRDGRDGSGAAIKRLPSQVQTPTQQQQQSYFRGPEQSRDNKQRLSLDIDRNRDGERTRASGFTRDGDRDRNEWSRTADRIRDDWRRYDRDKLPFRYGWWDGYRGSGWPVFSPWGYSRWSNQPYYWWGWTPATRLTNWFVYGAVRPAYWGYGPGSNIYYQGDYVYYDNQQYLPANDYYQQVYALAHAVPQIDPNDAENMDWAPLGVFAATRGMQSDERNIQLAVNKDGVITGTYFNPQKNEAHPLTGMVDKRNQRAAWAFADRANPSVVFETSLFNLTKSESSMMVHYGPSASEAEVWRLVRLEAPSAVNTLPAPIAPPAPQNQLP